MSVITERIALRKLIKCVKWYASTADCDCDACKAIRYGLREDRRLTRIINANNRVKAMWGTVITITK